MQARYYDPVIGRFYSNDPVGYTAKNPVMSFNRYMYVNNNPYKYTDPSGETLIEAIAVGIIATAIYLTVDDAGKKMPVKATAANVDAKIASQDALAAYVNTKGADGTFEKMKETMNTAVEADAESLKQTGEFASSAAQITTIGIPGKGAELIVPVISATKTIVEKVIEPNTSDELKRE
jgi:uncharacterized protein RhaS with RHS repeats